MENMDRGRRGSSMKLVRVTFPPKRTHRKDYVSAWCPRTKVWIGGALASCLYLSKLTPLTDFIIIYMGARIRFVLIFNGAFSKFQDKKISISQPVSENHRKKRPEYKDWAVNLENEISLMKFPAVQFDGSCLR